jgi:hypothetical protein
MFRTDPEACKLCVLGAYLRYNRPKLNETAQNRRKSPRTEPGTSGMTGVRTWLGTSFKGCTRLSQALHLGREALWAHRRFVFAAWGATPSGAETLRAQTLARYDNRGGGGDGQGVGGGAGVGAGDGAGGAGGAGGGAGDVGGAEAGGGGGNGGGDGGGDGARGFGETGSRNGGRNLTAGHYTSSLFPLSLSSVVPEF